RTVNTTFRSPLVWSTHSAGVVPAGWVLPHCGPTGGGCGNPGPGPGGSAFNDGVGDGVGVLVPRAAATGDAGGDAFGDPEPDSERPRMTPPATRTSAAAAPASRRVLREPAEALSCSDRRQPWLTDRSDGGGNSGRARAGNAGYDSSVRSASVSSPGPVCPSADGWAPGDGMSTGPLYWYSSISARAASGR